MSRTGLNGSLVAFEGSSETIATQLRLLPSSSRVLVLPSIEQYLPDDGLPSTAGATPTTASAQRAPFDAPEFIRKVHEAASTRRKIALDFLRTPTPGLNRQKKFVFLHGGTASSHALCIDALRQHVTATNGDLEKAAALFDELAADGVPTGDEARPFEPPRRRFLKSARRARPTSTLSGMSSLTGAGDNADPVDASLDDDGGDYSDENDPIMKAMRAADDLDRETEGLQPTSHILDLTITARSRSLSTPFNGSSDVIDVLSVDRYVSNRFSQASDRSSGVWARSNDEFLPAISSPTSTVYLSAPRSDNATQPSSPLRPEHHASASFGAESRPVLIGPAPRGRSRGSAQHRSQSAERKPTPSRPRLEAVGMNFILNSRDPSTRRHSAISDAFTTDSSEQPRPQLDDVPDMPVIARTADARRRTLVPGHNRNLKSGSSHSWQPARYIDRGTDARNYPDGFEPVLPLVEDLVIQFKDASSTDEALDLAIRRCKELVALVVRASTVTPVPYPGDETQEPKIAEFPATPTSSQGHPHEFQPLQPTTAPSSDDYDPFAPGEYHSGIKLPEAWASTSAFAQNSKKTPVIIKTAQPPTPAQTPPPSRTTGELASGSHVKFHEFSTAGYPTAVAMQNSLRSVLRMYLPVDAVGSQSLFCLPETGSDLWQPLFEEDGADRIDLVLALGAQVGVYPEFKNKITAKLEALGSRPASGETRSGRLDIRYLTATAMQTFAAQHAISRVREDPFSDVTAPNTSLLLGALVVAQLDLYLRVHPDVRFVLLDYPPELLALVLVVQKLVGRNTVQVIGIVDAEGRGLTEGGAPTPKDETEAFKPVLGNRHPSFTKVNFLLMSVANASEVTTFVSTIWKRLTGISSAFYGPQNPILVVNHLANRQKLQLAPETTSRSFVSSASSISSDHSPAKTITGLEAALPDLVKVDSNSSRRTHNSRSASAQKPSNHKVHSHKGRHSQKVTNSVPGMPRSALQKPAMSTAGSSSTMRTLASSSANSATSYATANTMSSSTTVGPPSILEDPPSPVASTMSRFSESAWTVKTMPSQAVVTALAPPPVAGRHKPRSTHGSTYAKYRNEERPETPVRGRAETPSTETSSLMTSRTHTVLDDESVLEVDDDTDYESDMRRLMPLFMRERPVSMIRSSAASTTTRTSAMTDARSRRRAPSEVPSSVASVASTNKSITSQRTVGRSRTFREQKGFPVDINDDPQTKNNSQKALRWLGLA